MCSSNFYRCHRRRSRRHSVDDCGLFVVDAMLLLLSSLTAKALLLRNRFLSSRPHRMCATEPSRLMLGNNLCTSIVSTMPATVLRQIFCLRLWPPPPHGKRDVLCNDEAILSIVEFVCLASLWPFTIHVLYVRCA